MNRNLENLLDIPYEVSLLVKDQVKFFRNFTPGYIHDHYKIGPTDMVVHFKKEEIGVLKNMEAIEQRSTVKERSTVLAIILKEFNENPKYHDLVQSLNLVVPFCFSDMPIEKLQHIPALTFSKNSFSNSILIPSLNSLIGYREYEALAYADKPLFHKKDMMSFCGSLTNIYWNEHGIQHNQRLQIAWMAKQSPDKWFCKVMKPPRFDDAEWTDVVGKIDQSFPGLTESDAFSSEPIRVDVTDQLKYKFQVCIDGHTCAWARLPWQMKSNSVVFKIRNPQDNFVEWFYPLLQSSKHFLELDTHHLLDAYEYMIHEPDYQQYLSNNASEFVNKYLNSDLAKRILLYTLLLLNDKQENIQ